MQSETLQSPLFMDAVDSLDQARDELTGKIDALQQLLIRIKQKYMDMSVSDPDPAETLDEQKQVDLLVDKQMADVVLQLLDLQERYRALVSVRRK